MDTHSRGNQSKLTISGLFFVSRMILILSLPLEGLKSYGDFWNFYSLAQLGRPFWDLWVEFPPLFPFLSRGIYLISGGREHSYIYLSTILFSLIQAGNLYLFQLIAAEIWGKKGAFQRAVFYAFLSAGLFYGWAYFDCVAVFLTLWGLYLIQKNQYLPGGSIIAVGGLTKWFPLLVLPALWKKLGKKQAIRVMVSAALVMVLVWGALLVLSPTNTRASLVSQGAKGSWESIWAILDGNMRTGNFNPAVNRTDPTTASLPAGNPALISPWITLLVFAGLGYFIFWKAEIKTATQQFAFCGVTLLVFFIWSPGYSPQWVLYLLPFIMLSFEFTRSSLIALIAVFINLLEWPLLLSRGLFQYLPGLIGLRTFIYLFIAVVFLSVLFPGESQSSERTA